MEIRKTKNGIKYRESITIFKKKIHSPLFSRRTDAKNWKLCQDREKSLALSRGFEVNNHITVEELAKHWSLNNIGKSKRTIESYESSLKNYILPMFKSFKLIDLKPYHGDEFKIMLLAKGLSAVTINNKITSLIALFNFAVGNENLIKSPFSKLKKINVETKPIVYWDFIEAEKFLKVNRNNFYYSLYLTALNTGMRKAELCGLKWDCVDFENKLITVSRTRDKFGLKESTKSKQIRIIPMTGILITTLRKLCDEKKNFEFVFTGLNGNPVCYNHIANRYFAKSVALSGVKKIRFHDLRKTFGSLFIRNGGDMFVLQKLLGHKTIVVTQKSYAHICEERLKDQMTLVNFGESTFLSPKREENLHNLAIVRQQ